MTEYEKLIAAEKTAHTIEIEETVTGKCGVANSTETGVMVFYGNDDGTDDREFTAEEFSRRFKITAVIRD